jgi:Protein of unknown function (DUF2950)
MEKQDMRTTEVIYDDSLARRLLAMLAPALFALFMLGLAQWSLAQSSGATTFASAEAASQALVQAAQNHDEQALEAILGAGREITSTGDDTVDRLEREQFSRKYEEMHRLVREPDGTTVLYIGAENWPFPIPLASRNGKWFFDARTGSQEILFRRIGENEATAAEVCRTLTGATQQDQTTADPIGEFARAVVYEATGHAVNTSSVAAEKESFHGYHFRALNGEPRTTAAAAGSSAAAGKNLVDVAFVAYPVEYRSSGVMTFVVTNNGLVYERDLGPETSRLAREIQERSTVSGWSTVN